ncbi:ribosome biogenesis GTP-binding protein YihA/YsxC [Candidatus Pantoea edessiphila]|uniref:Probable GTP-binding protein EngB n=1 Tax=Candidatus Pantoea edessiphila TaxID=2044610 RepID=A0A2P5SVR2_9GAMM|nr:ribosome biogenesis GTP-binding protein YihA/YsxC [Candidatus Pantoea edessiphila]PPI86425.1 YihA family ribosome biogenesis GTP-binding protein [Candidatus Pantoea edessiphila]
MPKFNYQNTSFIMSVPNVNYLPINNGIEVAFIGRSNAGKSSLLNKLTNQKNLARKSKKPGCTKLINLFKVVENKYLVDLPGYGYAKISRCNRINLQHVLLEYIRKKNNLIGLVLLLDIKYTLNNFDKRIIKLARDKNISLLILLTKADKFNCYAQNIKLNIIRETLTNFIENVQVEIISSFKNIGVDNVYQKLNIWFQNF